MSDYIVLRRIQLGPFYRPTGKTRHFYGHMDLPPPNELSIVKYPSDPGYYLIYFDDKGTELTDTYHDTLEGALTQAEWEFEVKPNEWEVIGDL